MSSELDGYLAKLNAAEKLMVIFNSISEPGAWCETRLTC